MGVGHDGDESECVLKRDGFEEESFVRRRGDRYSSGK